jgi:hypothetical protein
LIFKLTVEATSIISFATMSLVLSAQVLLTSANNTGTETRRLVVAPAAGNSGALVYFLPLILASNANTATNETLSVHLVDKWLTSTTDEFNNVGVQGDLAFNKNATLCVTIIDAVRARRGM